MWCHNKQSCAKAPGLTLTTERQLGKCGESILVKPELPGSTALNAAIQESLGEENLDVYKAEDVRLPSVTLGSNKYDQCHHPSKDST